jgi:hypothetical protein
VGAREVTLGNFKPLPQSILPEAFLDPLVHSQERAARSIFRKVEEGLPPSPATLPTTVVPDAPLPLRPSSHARNTPSSPLQPQLMQGARVCAEGAGRW